MVLPVLSPPPGCLSSVEREKRAESEVRLYFWYFRNPFLRTLSLSLEIEALP